MLTKRVIPCMDVKDGRVVKGVNFVNLRDAGDPIELAQRATAVQPRSTWLRAQAKSYTSPIAWAAGSAALPTSAR